MDIEDFSIQWGSIEREVRYLRRNHPHLFPSNFNEFISSHQPITNEMLKQINVILDEINKQIIRIEIDKNNHHQPNTILDLSGKHISRFPVELFKQKKYKDYWKSLTSL